LRRLPVAVFLWENCGFQIRNAVAALRLRKMVDEEVNNINPMCK